MALFAYKIREQKVIIPVREDRQLCMFNSRHGCIAEEVHHTGHGYNISNPATTELRHA